MTGRITRLRSVPPEPSLDNPFVQLDWLWENFSAPYKNLKTIDNHSRTLTAYKNFLMLNVSNFDQSKKDFRFNLAEDLNQFSLCDAEAFWRSKLLSSWTIYNRIKILRAVFSYAAAAGLTPVSQFIMPEIDPQRETDEYEAYSEEELEILRKIISEVTVRARVVTKGYKRTNSGKDPRNYPDFKKHPVGKGWQEWDNLVWYFENVLNCIPLLKTEPMPKNHYRFIMAARKYHGGINAVWSRLGVVPYIGPDLIIPLAMKLAWETGLNTGSIFSLERGCFEDEHALSGRPFIRYFKPRSKGEKELHVALFDRPDEAHLQLLPKQSEIIGETIELILKLTQPLVDMAAEEDKKYLLLFQSFRVKRLKGADIGVIRLNRSVIKDWSRNIINKYKKLGVNCLNVISLNRFRPTKITQMVQEGHDFFRIQAVAGHSSLMTTSKYITVHQIEPKAHREISKTLVQIQRNASKFASAPKSYATSLEKNNSDHIYKGILSDCKNPFDPPSSVKGLKSYEKGQACTYWNMCLVCPNVIITSSHLPLLIKYKGQIESALSGQNLTQVPNIAHYEKLLAILSEILREFSEEEKKRAIEMSASNDTIIDPVTYKTTNEKR